MEVNEPVHTSSPKCSNAPKCGEDRKCGDNTPDVVITVPPGIPPVVIQPLPDLSPEPVLAPLPDDGGAKGSFLETPRLRLRPRPRPLHHLPPLQVAVSGSLHFTFCTTTEMFLLKTVSTKMYMFIWNVFLFYRKWSTRSTQVCRFWMVKGNNLQMKT